MQAPGGIRIVELASTSGIQLLDEARLETAHTLGFGQATAAT
jgi:glycerate kinase